MSTTPENKQHAHELVDRLDASQIPTAVRFLEFILLDPVSRALATAPFDEEPLTESGRKAIAEADAWLKHNEPVSHKDVLAELGLSSKDWDKMSNEPIGKPQSKIKPRRHG